MLQHPSIAVRPYEDADLDGVRAVFLRSVREVAARDYNAAQVEAWAQADRAGWRTRRSSRQTWVAVAGEIVAGFADLKPMGHLDMMYVHPAYQRLGIATSLLFVVEDSARSQKLSAIVTEASITARPFFGRRGFEIVAQQDAFIRGQYLSNFRMRKGL